MTECIGAAASAVQIATLCVKFVGITRNFSDSKSKLEKHQCELQRLHDITIAISQNPFLDTTEVAAQTSSILHTIKQSKIGELLEKNPVVRNILFLFDEQAFTNLFTELHRSITLLALLISNIQSTVLYSIYTEHRVMAGNTRTDKSSIRSIGSMSQDSQFSCPKFEEGCSSGSLIPYRGRQPGVNDPPPSELPSVLSPSDPAAVLSMIVPPHLGILNKDQRENLRKEIDISPDAALSWGNVADSGGTQVNGLALEGDAECLKSSDPLPPGQELYINNIEKGVGDQMNGLYVNVDGDLTQTEVGPANYCFNYAFGDPDCGTQYNGARYVMRQRK